MERKGRRGKIRVTVTEREAETKREREGRKMTETKQTVQECENKRMREAGGAV